MSAAAAFDYPVRPVPLPLALTSPEPGEVLNDGLPEFVLLAEGAHYDNAAQLNVTADGLPFIEMRGSKCSGICGTRVGTILISDRDSVSDD
jgi:hypothetical protein